MDGFCDGVRRASRVLCLPCAVVYGVFAGALW